MNNQVWWLVYRYESGWAVSGPHKVVKFINNTFAILEDGLEVEMSNLYHTKGGASKKVHKLNYLERTKS